MAERPAPLARTASVLGAVVLVLCSVGVGHCRASDRQQRPFDFLFLVRQWDPTYCDFAHCTIDPDRADFTLHGLWPNYDNGRWPEFCDPSLPFREGAVDDLLPDLKRFWPSFTSRGDSFWQHEWEKHGTCAKSVYPTEHAYFSGVLNLHRRYNLRDALAAAGITASNYNTYQADDAVAAIDALTGVAQSSVLHCKGGELSEVYMCLDDNTRPVQCPETVYHQECGTFTMPLLKHDSPDSTRPS